MTPSDFGRLENAWNAFQKGRYGPWPSLRDALEADDQWRREHPEITPSEKHNQDFIDLNQSAKATPTPSPDEDREPELPDGVELLPSAQDNGAWFYKSKEGLFIHVRNTEPSQLRAIADHIEYRERQSQRAQAEAEESKQQSAFDAAHIYLMNQKMNVPDNVRKIIAEAIQLGISAQRQCQGKGK